MGLCPRVFHFCAAKRRVCHGCEWACGESVAGGQLFNGEMPHFLALFFLVAQPATRALLGESGQSQKQWRRLDGRSPAVQQKIEKIERWSEMLPPPPPPLPLFLSFSPPGNPLLSSSYSSVLYIFTVPFRHLLLIVTLLSYERVKPPYWTFFSRSPRLTSWKFRFWAFHWVFFLFSHYCSRHFVCCCASGGGTENWASKWLRISGANLIFAWGQSGCLLFVLGFFFLLCLTLCVHLPTNFYPDGVEDTLLLNTPHPRANHMIVWRLAGGCCLFQWENCAPFPCLSANSPHWNICRGKICCGLNHLVIYNGIYILLRQNEFKFL